MPLAQADRIAFSLNIVTAPAQTAAINANKTAIQSQAQSIQQLDQANANLMAIPNAIINAYQPEIAFLDGNVRTTVVEQDIQDAANKILGNHFFPNVMSTTVPSLAAKNNVWPYIQPYALGFAIGRNYSEGYAALANPEPPMISAILSYTNTTDPKTVSATVTAYIAVLQAELAVIPIDTNAQRQSNNTLATNSITKFIIPALQAYLAASHPVVPAAAPGTASSGVLATPDPYFAPMQSAVTVRQTFVTTRLSQLNIILGSISQDVGSGNILASSGAYGQRYSAIALRLNSLSGSLAQLASLNTGINAQTALQAGLGSAASTYSAFLPTSALKADANNLTTIHVANSSLFSPGDLVYIYAEGQTELVRAVSSINNDAVVLNDIVPAKYTLSCNARIYKDLS